MKNLLAISEQKMILPNVSGSNLLRQKIELPSSLRGNLNLLFIAFYQWQQIEVNSWLPLVHELEQTQSGFFYYELPTIQRMNVFAQKFVNEGMRAGIPDHSNRERTITLYIDKQAFKRELNMPDEDHIYVLLTDQAGKILWSARGEMTVEYSQSLWKAIKELSLQA